MLGFEGHKRIPFGIYDRPDWSNVDYAILLDAIPIDERSISVSGLKGSTKPRENSDAIEAGLEEWARLRDERIEEVYATADFIEGYDPYHDA